jgi:NAD(P)-dependent dehydrogenase (short-subunit alcohol dehydrogenase family)
VPRFEPHPARRPAIVTGASSGIGAATARALAAAGHPVVLGARRVEECDTIAGEINGEGGEAVACFLDMADPDALRSFVAAAEDAFGAPEVVVSNAGNVWPQGAVASTPGDFANEVAVNLLGAQHLVHLVAPGMVERRRGDLVFVTSDVVRNVRPGVASYVAAKWGLEGLARALQLEMEGTGVRASIVSPGPTITGMGSGWDGETTTELLEEWSRFGLMRHGGYLRPEGVAAAIVAVVSAPRGTLLASVEVQPEAPVEPWRDRAERTEEARP